ncbi:hypothetical protein CYFUS_000247 [Cystobacter fuscus]|uniref:Uncharacterized protein n=1 Tax=Cystobacter fuscus TaxID=43 RepID=A0A250IUC1_9BACT|nr:hypothetical protein CYFUS_000247 [Cystobacter fuscus]
MRPIVCFSTQVLMSSRMDSDFVTKSTAYIPVP